MAGSNTQIHVDDRFKEYKSVSKCQKSTNSKVWDEVTKLECESKDELKAQFKAGLELADDVVGQIQNGINSNVSDHDPVDSSLYQLNVNRVHLGADYDESKDYKRYLSESSTKSGRSQLDIYLEEPELELNNQIDVLDYWNKSSIRYCELSILARDLLTIPISTIDSKLAFSIGKKCITSLRSSLKLKTVQAVVCFDDWMRAKGFSMEIDCNNDESDDKDEDDEDNDSSIPF
ncbi:hypothetical protein CXB51_004818 [Gossypium anomalum]|uniref:HAT C-terminal dimerisation domain-containing protein n=1 Tax=Gossypium anomalum TaxID=47600 RepID=A0A8J5ZD59_9ROSI|nr:hypothetical protein CXB51_004818 [Gossypium anomalum]